MRKLIFFWLTLIYFAGFAQSPPDITRIEYFIDTDPGYGLATAVSISPGKVINTNFNVNIGGISEGFHALFMRAKDSDLKWSSVINRAFYKQKYLSDKSINYLEYFIDTDPGYGSATSIPVTAASNQDKSIVISLNSLTNGFHTLYARAKDKSNFWSTVINKSFYKTSYFADKSITYLEYFIDTDPGYGKAVSVSINPSENINTNIIVPLGSLADGFHAIYFRAKDKNNFWSTVMIRSFLKEKYYADKSVTYLEYFFDTDPGYGKGTVIPVNSANVIDNSFTADISSLTDGFHTIYYRCKDTNNRWSHVYNRSFLKVMQPTDEQLKLTQIEYFVDTDPGFGLATKYDIPEEEQNKIIVKDFMATLPDLGPSNHTFYVRLRDKRGVWSHTYDTVYCQGPSAKFTVDPVCEGQSSTLKYSSSIINENTNFFWDVDNNGTVDFTTKGSITHNYQNAGTYYAKLVVTNSNVCPNFYKDNAIVKVVVSSVPSASINPSGTVSICPGDATGLTANTGIDLTYQWYKNDFILNGATGSVFNPNDAGLYKVVVTSPGNCSAASDVTTVSFKTQPTAVITPAGPTDICPGGIVVMNANTGANLTYQWQLNGNNITDATTSSYTTNETGNYNVIVNDLVGCPKSSNTVSVVVHPFPDPNLGSDRTINARRSTTLDAGGGYSQYLWNDNSTDRYLAVNGPSLGEGDYTYSVTVTDAYGCSGADTIIVHVIKPLYFVSGLVRYENTAHTPLDSVRLYLLDKETLAIIDSTTTDLNGNYIFEDIQIGAYTIICKFDKEWRGGNPVDALLIIKYYINLFDFNSELKRRAANVNKDNTTNPVDALFVNKRYIQTVSSFKAGDWVFDNPSLEITTDDIILNINALCFGDVNGSYSF